MNDTICNNSIKLNINENSLHYIFDDESIFYEVGYKVLQNQEKFGLVKCGKLSQNGKLKLVYDVTKYKSLADMTTQMNMQNFLLIISRLYDVVKHVEENGFLKCENIEISSEKIFIDSSDLSIHLICIPIVNISIYQNTHLFYDSLKQVVLNEARNYPDLHTSEIMKIINEENNKEKLKESQKQESIVQISKDNILPSIDNNLLTTVERNSNMSKKGVINNIASFFSPKKNIISEKSDSNNYITLSSTNHDEEIKFMINKPIFIIGKQMGSVDGVIQNEKTISRLHCKILKENKKYYIQDMGSLNGTYVNNKKIAEGQKMQIFLGDIIRMSNIDFIVR